MVTPVELATNFIFGLLSAFSPCLFPLLPSYVALNLQSKQSRFKIFLSSLALILGIMIVFLSLGSISSLIGGFLISNYSVFARIQGSLLILAGLIMIKTPSFMYNISLPDKLDNWLFSEERSDQPILFSFVLGLVFTIIAAPCAAGYFIGVWTILLDQSFLSQVLLVFIFSLGAGAPFIIMSLFVPELQSDLVGKVREASVVITKILGVILVIVGTILILEVAPNVYIDI